MTKSGKLVQDGKKKPQNKKGLLASAWSVRQPWQRVAEGCDSDSSRKSADDDTVAGGKRKRKEELQVWPLFSLLFPARQQQITTAVGPMARGL